MSFRMLTDDEFITLQRDATILTRMNPIKKKNYLTLYSLYMHLFIHYLQKLFDLKKYDDIINKDSHNFLPVLPEKKDTYQLLASNFYKYFYIRNTLYIERLTKKEINYLRSKLDNNDSSFDDKDFDFISSTYQKVIYEVINSNYDTKGLINYGPISPSYFAPNNALVIGIRYDEFNQNNLSDDEWLKNYDEQMAIFNKIKQEIEENAEQILQNPCKVILYSDNSVIMYNDDIKNNSK